MRGLAVTDVELRVSSSDEIFGRVLWERREGKKKTSERRWRWRVAAWPGERK